MRIQMLFISLFVGFFCQSVLAVSLRISPEELNKKLDSNSLIILDVRNKDDYDVGHIKTAISFPVDLTYDNKEVNGKIQNPELMQKYLRERGVDTDSKVVVYDGGTLVHAARAFWVLEVFGVSNVRILDHGFNYWLDKSLPTTQEDATIHPSQYITTINHQRLASKFTTQLAMHNKNKLVIDARPNDAYIGKVSVAKRFGHIPSAINVPFENNINKEGKFATIKTIDELKSLYSDVPHGKKIIIYCKIGLVSSTNYFALRELDYDVSNYDASWREWGNDESLPIDK